MIEKKQIDLDETLVPGDVIELHYKTTGLTLLRAAQVAVLEARLRSRKDFELVSSSYGGNNLILTIRIIQPLETEPGLQKAGVVNVQIITAAISFLAVGAMAWLLLDKIYKISESPAGKLALGGVGTLAIVTGIFVLLAILRKSK